MMASSQFPHACRIAAILAVTAALAACGGPSSSTATPSASSNGRQFVADTFSATIPNGWSDHTSDSKAVASISASGTVKMLMFAPQTSAPIGNEHIDVSTSGQPVPDDQLSSYLQSVTQNGATNASQPQPFNLDTSTGLFITYELQAQGTSSTVQLKAQDMLVNHGGQTYEIVLNTASSDFNAQLPALQQVLQSWRWTA